MAATQHRNLWSGRPVWFSYPASEIACSPLTCNIRTDVVVIGAGISGALMAEELTDNGFSVVILDRRVPARGSTAASTALLQYDLDSPLTKLAQQIGHDKASRAWRRSKLGLESLASKTRALGIACNLERRDALYLTGNILDAGGLRAEADARKSIGLPTEYLARSALYDRFGIKRPAALCIRDNLSVNPRRCAAGYLLQAVNRGARIFSPETVMEIETGYNSITAYTENGSEIKARYVVFTTGYEVFKKIKLKHRAITSSWALATKAQPGKLWPERVHIWEASDPYLYIRTTSDGRVLCGGEDEDFSDEETRDALIPKKTAILQHKLKKLFPGLDTTAEFAWAGCFGETKTGLPMLGAVPGIANCFAVLAFGGNGITFSRIAAEMISAALKGREDPDADLFSLR